MNLKLAFKTFLLISTNFFLVASDCYSQTSGMQVFDDVARTSQLYGKTDSLLSYCIRPNFILSSNDSFYKGILQQKPCMTKISESLNFSLLPVVLQQQYNTHHAYGWNDGSMIPAKGSQTQLSFGVSYKKGVLSLQARPEFVFAYNPYFSTFPFTQIDNVWNNYHEAVLNVIDAPERFGYGRYFKLFPGQSNIKVNHKNLSFGVSTENLWWGPGIRNSLVMSNNAPGFPHLSFNTSQPVKSIVGSFEWQLISGVLKGSNILPDDTSRRQNGLLMYRPKEFKDRYINGVVVAWQPKWTKGLFLGFSRVFYQYLADVKPNLNGYIPVIGKLFKKNLPSEDALKRDQLASFFFRLLLPKEKAEVYGEFGRNDHSFNLTDFLLQPEHSRAYTIGVSKIFDGKTNDLQLFAEMTNLQMPSTMLIRQGQSWYVHYQIREGYTHQGQVIGAGIGPGGSSQTIGLKWISALNRTGITFERVVRNNDFYYYSFYPMAEWRKNWVDLSITATRSWHTKKIVYDAQLAYIHSLNYQWYYPNTSNISARLGLCYLF